jgi:hypothetical protein
VATDAFGSSPDVDVGWIVGSRLGGLPLRVAFGPPGVAHAAPPVSIQCADVAASSEFYDGALRPLGAVRVMDFGSVVGYGTARKPSFWLVRAFFDAAVAAGAEVLHEPRLWPEYHPDYYGAFVRDPDDNNVEAVCHTPE